MTRVLPYLIAKILALPVGVGVIGTVLPAFGYLPALGREDLTLQPFRDLLAEPGLLRSCILSLASGLVTTLVSLIAVLAFLAASAQTRAGDILARALAPLLAVPHAAAAFGLAFLLAPSGFLFRIIAGPLGFETPPDLLIVGDRAGLAMMAGLVVKEIPFLLLVAQAALPRLDAPRRIAIARSLGHARPQAFVLAVWPDLYRRIRLPVLAVAAFASSVVDVALILGPSTPAPLAVRLLAWMRDPDLAMRLQASAGALLQLALTAGVLLAWIGLERAAGAWRRRFARSGRRVDAGAVSGALALLPALASTFAIGFGILILALWSFAGLWTFPDILPESFGFTAWRRAWPRAGELLGTSAAIALSASLIALLAVVALLESRRRASPAEAGKAADLPRAILALLYLPLIVPQISFLFGIEVAALSLGLRPSLPLVVAAHLVFVAPYVALVLADPWFGLDPRYERIAASLGRHPFPIFLRIRLPLLLAPILASLAVGFAVSIGQYLPTLALGAGRVPTITTEAVALSSGGDRRVVGVYALLQALLPLLVFALAAAYPLLRRPKRSAKPGP